MTARVISNWINGLITGPLIMSDKDQQTIVRALTRHNGIIVRSWNRHIKAAAFVCCCHAQQRARKHKTHPAASLSPRMAGWLRSFVCSGQLSGLGITGSAKHVPQTVPTVPALLPSPPPAYLSTVTQSTSPAFLIYTRLSLACCLCSVLSSLIPLLFPSPEQYTGHLLSPVFPFFHN